MDRFAWDDTELASNERFIIHQSGISLYDGDNKTNFDSGIAALTTHKLSWRDPKDQTCIIALNLTSVVFIEEQPAGFAKSSKIVVHLSQAESSVRARPVTHSSFSYIKLSFREAGEVEFYRAFSEVLQWRTWEKVLAAKPAVSAAPKHRPGIVGIERKIQQRHHETQKEISAAFEDLTILIDKAKNMVDLSKNISCKIKDKQGDITEDETIKFKSYLLSLGIPDPVTRETHGSGSMYHMELAKELSRVLETPLQQQGGVMTLTDVYCWVNRMRGMELVSPDDILKACKMLEHLKLPTRLRIFDSGVIVIQLLSHSEEKIIEETSKLLEEKDSFTAQELANLIQLSVVLAKERLLATEKAGKACRDDSVEGLRFYPNLFMSKKN